MALKLAIVRVDDNNPKKKTILLERDIGEELAAELEKLHLPGFRKRSSRRALAALAVIEQRLREDTVKLP